jgi:glycosyltransferase involved in cell wall biosynthesis
VAALELTTTTDTERAAHAVDRADSPVLLTVSGSIDPGTRDEIARGRRPRADYFELAAAFGAEIVDFERAATLLGPIGGMLRRLGWHDVALALACFKERRRRRAIFTDSELVGMLYAAATRLTRKRTRPRHVMIGHWLSPRGKILFHRLLGLRATIDKVAVYASAQRDVAVDQLGYRPDQIALMPFMVDTSFWTGPPAPSRQRPMICAVGQELRDYETLVEAVRGLDVDVVVAAASPWSRRDDSSAGIDLPANVSVVRLDQYHLRDLYREARFVVVPLVESDFQAGITTILEAMSMSLAVVCSRTAGQTDTLVDGETGVYVPPRDPAALRRAIERLLADPADADRLGRNGQRWVRENADIGVYARHLAALVEGS